MNNKIDAIKKYGINMNIDCKNKLLIGRHSELRLIMQTLTRREKNSPILVGPAGTGKTAIVYGLCSLIQKDKVPSSLKNFQIYSINLNQLEAGTKFQGELEQRIENILQEAKTFNKCIILFIDEIHMLLNNKIANVIKPYISSGDIKCIGATTTDEYRKYIEPDTALKRRFNLIQVEEPNIAETINIVRGIKHKLQNYYSVNISDKIIQKAAILSKKYFVTYYNPDLTLELIDDTASRIKFEREIEPYTIAKIANQITELSLELESVKIEDEAQDRQQIKVLQEKISTLTEKYNVMKQKWQEEKHTIEQIMSIQEKINNLQDNIAFHKLNNNFAEAGRLLYLELPKYKTQLKILEKNANFQYISLEIQQYDLLNTISKKTNIGIEQLSYDASSIKKLFCFLTERIIGQHTAINTICQQLKRVFGGFRDPKRPLSTLCFLGPTGVGKTEVAKLLGEFMFNDKNAIKIINMSQYQEKHNITALFGTTAGYVGYKEEGILTGAVRLRPYQIILLDEIEKADPSIHDALLAILDNGIIEDNAGRKTNFREAIIIMTLNLYSDTTRQVNDEANNQTEILSILHRIFRPEFVGRIDTIVKFNQIDKQHYHQIMHYQIHHEVQLFKQNTGISISIAPEICTYLSKLHINTTYGVRQIKQFLQHHLYNKIIDAACDMNEQDKKQKFIFVSLKETKINIELVNKYNN